MKIAYLDCFSGASGNMLVGALLDAGLPFDPWRHSLESLGLHGIEPVAEKIVKNGITATHFKIDEGRHEHVHRGLNEIGEIVSKSTLSETVKARTMKVFGEIARVEGEIHGIAPEEVHFHEIGAADSIYDIAGAILGFEMMGIEKAYASKVAVGHGTVRTAHGILPVPAPATIRLLEGIPAYDGGAEDELTTPTGAALLRELVSSFGVFPAMRAEMTGYGAGTKSFPGHPNVLRIVIGESDDSPDTARENVIEIVTNLDTLTPEAAGYARDALLDAGALDVTLEPVTMKKGRAGIVLCAIAHPKDEAALLKTLFRETGTLGARVRRMERVVLRRETVTVSTEWGDIRVKIGCFDTEAVSAAPEYEDCREAARGKNVPFRKVFDEAKRKAEGLK
ncbi:MAG: TIGR00299 family protein [Spirochaetes bacterium GWF1_51_8]|nr:MAG: TIGR00299 family protein [Spirochaetes bacterium GWF1_51_8]